MSDTLSHKNDAQWTARVLIVDDTPINLELLVTLVEELGHEVVQAENGPQALEQLEAGNIDMVLLDYLMPEMSGLEVLKAIRQTHTSVDLPVLLVTGFYETKIVVEALHEGANDYISKPFDTAVLEARIGVHLQRKLIEKHLISAKNTAEAENQAKSDFLSYVSHEVRNPLNSILGFCKLLIDDANANRNEEYLEMLEIIQSSGNRLLGITNDILDLSRIESGKLSLTYQEFPLAGFIRAVVAEINPVIMSNTNSIEVDYSKAPEIIVADEQRLRQILLNLLSNAAKFTKDGSITLEVKKAEHDGKGAVQFSIHDTGMGIPESKMNDLFKSFSQVHSHSLADIQSIGLGLMITRQLCEQMRGEITVQSTEGEGSTFSVRIPEDQQGAA